MKVNELRIGNYVQDIETGRPVVFVCLDIESPRERCFIKFIDSPGEWDRGWPLVDVLPIPITKEWLFKLYPFCFDRHHCTWSMDGNIWDLNMKTGDVWLKHYPYKHHTNIKFIHQMQNFYFAMLGEELTIRS